MKKLPIGIQDFEDLIVNNYVYIDKTPYLHRLLESGGKYIFLSRPRRFGKSLLLSTIKAMMKGRKELFKDLHIYDKISWESHSVILLDMGSRANASVEEFKNSLVAEIRRIAEGNGVSLPNFILHPNDLLTSLVSELAEKTGKQVVLLIDEYDKAILDAMDDPQRARQIREFLRNFYTVIKSISPYLRFTFLTGVSKISQVSIFSGLNNLNDITMDAKYAGICGYTQSELESCFHEHIDQLAEYGQTTGEQTLKKIRDWYNGYSWDGKTFVYNPFSVLLLFDKNLFAPHWFATGTPTFLLKLMRERNDLSPVLEDEMIQYLGFTDQQSLEKLDLVPLLFQTGYLTVKRIEEDEIYHLVIPNLEVRVALTQSLLAYSTGESGSQVRLLARHIYDQLAQGNVGTAVDHLRTLFSGITYSAHVPYEAHYHALFQLAMKLIGIHHQAEVLTDKGRIDSVVKFPHRTYVVELKYAKDENGLDQALHVALQQIREKGYHEPYREPGKTLHLLALAFTKGKIKYKLEE
ncbi:MAG: AAA family ATPase [Mangrovibacterium sp.]|nr:AAA family ATPase [Mangrovibacterium sp.]